MTGCGARKERADHRRKRHGGPCHVHGVRDGGRRSHLHGHRAPPHPPSPVTSAAMTDRSSQAARQEKSKTGEMRVQQIRMVQCRSRRHGVDCAALSPFGQAAWSIARPRRAAGCVVRRRCRWCRSRQRRPRSRQRGSRQPVRVTRVRYASVASARAASASVRHAAQPRRSRQPHRPPLKRPEHGPEKCEAVFRKDHAQESVNDTARLQNPAPDLHPCPAPHRFAIPPSSWHVSARRLLPFRLHVGCETR